MATQVDREGNFIADIVDYGVKERESGAVCVSIRCKLIGIWNPETQQFDAWDEYDQEAYGDVYVIKKDQTLNDIACRSLVQNAGWDGDFDSLANHTWTPTRCQVQVKAEEYEGQVKYKVAFVNHIDRVPGALGSITTDRAKILKSQYGSQMRAIMGTAKQNAKPTPNGKPAAPPKAFTPPPTPAANDPVPF